MPFGRYEILQFWQDQLVMPIGKPGSGIEKWVKDVNLECNESGIVCTIMPLFFFVDLNNVT